MSANDLPRVHVHINKIPCKYCRCNVPEEDKRLTKWKTWMDIRKETHEMITSKTGRASGDMLMNSAENEHEKQENRLIIQYTKVVDKTDKYRDCPGFFAMPPSLFEKYWKRSPTYFSVKTKEQQCIVPEMQYIRTSDVVMEEKGITYSGNKCKLMFLKSKYLQQRRTELQERLFEIEPHKPTGDFTVIGTALLRNQNADFHSADVCVSPDSVVDYISAPLERTFPILKINGETIYNKSNGRKEITMNIEYDVFCNKVKQDPLSITNFSSKALRFSWSKIPILNDFEDYNMVYDVKRQAFFFNLNKFIVIPQQTKHLPIYFKSKSEGMYNEVWQLIIEPDLWKSNKLTIAIKLTCVATIKSFDYRAAVIKENLMNRVRDRIIDESLRKIIATVPEEKPEYVVYSYDKATLFEAINSSFSPINLRPKYLYNKCVVSELEAFYNLIKLDHHPDVWNLNLDSLRQCTKEREIRDKELQLQEQYKLLQEKLLKAEAVRRGREQLRQKLLMEANATATINSKAASKTRKTGKKSTKSPTKSKRSKTSSKKGAKASKANIEKAEITVPLIKHHNIPISLSQQLEDIVKKLHEPITWINEQQQKLNIAYLLFCAYFDKIQTDVIKLNVNFNTDHRTTYPKLPDFTPPLPLRMISEYHDDTMMQMAKFYDTCGTLYDKRAEPWVDEIPIEDYEKRYRAFHCIEADPKNVVNKKVGKSKKESKKSSKKEKSSLKSKKTAAKSDKTIPKSLIDEPRPRLTVIPYDPYADVMLKSPWGRAVSPISSNTVQSTVINVKDAYDVPPMEERDKELYRNNLYTIFYQNLAQAIDDLEALLILQAKTTIKHNIIQKVTDGFVVLNENIPETVKIIDLRRVISESLNCKDTNTKATLSRPCYKPLVKSKPTQMAMDKVKSDSSLWDILQRPKIPTQRLQPGDYMVKHSDAGRIDTTEASTSITRLDLVDEFKNLEYQDSHVQVETWELPRNVDCNIYCPCSEDTISEVYEPTLSKMKLKVKAANECSYAELLIDGTQNFKFYEDSDDEEGDNEVKIFS